ncbi:MAG: DUF421 domain-containing protein [Oscillospiraceae bacterium]|jgi:uncharacterized membrane protein YcaP (DUF421 family)|nr:DUF421 domain-containing protein [Oscillospiraceae bacterium]
MQNVFIRAVLLYIFCLIVMRIMGKRQLGELQPFELVITILVAQLAAAPMGDSGLPLIYGIVPLFAILVIHQLISFFMQRSSRIRAFVCGKPSTLIEKGKVQEDEMHNQMLNMEDLLSQLRSQGFVRLQDIETAVLEPNGQLSVLATAENQPVRPLDLNIQVSPACMPVALVIDGRVYSDNLRGVGRDEQWLQKQLSSQKTRAENVLLALFYPATNELNIQQKERKKAAL